MAYAVNSQDRWKGAGLAFALTATLGWALIAGLAVRSGATIADTLATFSVLPDPPPQTRERPIPPPQRDPRPAGEAAPPNLTSRPTEIVAPPLPTLATPVIAAPIAGEGAQPSAGAAELPGPGTGAGGSGDGFGAGGDGDGFGSGEADETPPQWLRGRIRDSDLPQWAVEEGIGGRVGVRYVVRTDGRVSDCEITRSSGSRALDAHTCRLIETRFRYRPSLDTAGRPVASAIVEDHEWVLEEERE
jgi:periplasmic protein TonB